MPTYEYRCPEGHTFDRFAKMSEAAAELPCPTCGKIAVRQVSGGAGLVFKGSGFYLTDYGKNAHRTGSDGRPAESSSKHESGEPSSNESVGGDVKANDPKPGETKSTMTDAASSSAPASAAAKSGTESAKSGTGSADAKSSSKKPRK